MRDAEGAAPGGVEPALDIAPPSGPWARAPAAEGALVASCRAEPPDSLAGHAGEEARADRVVAPLLLHP